jgi:hypothetical protein
MGMSMVMVLNEVGAGGSVPFREDLIVSQSRDNYDGDAVLHHSGQDVPCGEWARVTGPDKDRGVAFRPLHVHRCVNRSFDVLAVEIHWVHLYLGKCATFVRDVRTRK